MPTGIVRAVRTTVRSLTRRYEHLGGAVVRVRQPEVSFSREWIRSLARLEGSESRRVNQAVDQFVSDPDHPSLKLHSVKGDSTGRLHTIRASDDLRILLAKEEASTFSSRRGNTTTSTSRPLGRGSWPTGTRAS
jgi:hypothetical protein